jgi:membrane fusion protein (multidrug efflux system)
LPEQNYPDVKTGETVTFRVAAYDKDSFTGTVSHIAGAVRDTRDVLVEATVPNADQKLLPGMFADVELTIGQENLPSVSKKAVFESNGKQNVFVVKDGLLEQRVLQPGPELGDRLSVRRGVVANERVVTPYDPALSNGQRVR